MNIAQMFGPVVGGALLEVGGFKLPFLVMGTIQILMTFLSFGLPNEIEGLFYSIFFAYLLSSCALYFAPYFDWFPALLRPRLSRLLLQFSLL